MLTTCFPRSALIFHLSTNEAFLSTQLFKCCGFTVIQLYQSKYLNELYQLHIRCISFICIISPGFMFTELKTPEIGWTETVRGPALAVVWRHVAPDNHPHPSLHHDQHALQCSLLSSQLCHSYQSPLLTCPQHSQFSSVQSREQFYKYFAGRVIKENISK